MYAIRSYYVEDLGSQIIAKGALIQRTPLPRCPYPRTLLFQILSNLTSNALKYAADAGKPVEISGGETPDGDLELRVVDHGPGIPSAEREKVFEIFYRQRCHEDILGSGIGLATVKKLAERLDGTVRIEATAGGGASFVVTLPPFRTPGAPHLDS